MQHQESDIVSYNADFTEQEYHNLVEYTNDGGIAFAKKGDCGWGYYGKVKDVKEFLERLAPITSFLIKGRKFTGFCYTQLADVMQEVNGLLNEDRTPKIEYDCEQTPALLIR